MSKAQLLVVDDNALFRRTVAPILEQAGYGFTLAASGEEAVKAVREKPHDLLLLDLLMPGMDGVETLEKVRELHPKIRVIVITGYHLPQMELACRELGADGYLHKPFDPEDLRNKIAEALDGAAGKKH